MRQKLASLILGENIEKIKIDRDRFKISFENSRDENINLNNELENIKNDNIILEEKIAQLEKELSLKRVEENGK